MKRFSSRERLSIINRNGTQTFQTSRSMSPFSRIVASLFVTGILFRDAFQHHKPLSYLLLLGVFLFLCFLYDIVRAIFDIFK